MKSYMAVYLGEMILSHFHISGPHIPTSIQKRPQSLVKFNFLTGSLFYVTLIKKEGHVVYKLQTYLSL